MHPHHLLPVFSFYFAKVTKIIRVTNSIKSLNYNVYLTAIVDDKIQSINRCELSTVIITVYGSCYLGGCIYSLDCIVGVITMLVFPACRYDESTYDILNIVNMHVLHLLDWITNNVPF